MHEVGYFSWDLCRKVIMLELDLCVANCYVFQELSETIHPLSYMRINIEELDENFLCLKSVPFIPPFIHTLEQKKLVAKRHAMVDQDPLRRKYQLL